jgi:hypothetical protein
MSQTVSSVSGQYRLGSPTKAMNKPVSGQDIIQPQAGNLRAAHTPLSASGWYLARYDRVPCQSRRRCGVQSCWRQEGLRGSQ